MRVSCCSLSWKRIPNLAEALLPSSPLQHHEQNQGGEDMAAWEAFYTHETWYIDSNLRRIFPPISSRLASIADKRSKFFILCLKLCPSVHCGNLTFSVLGSTGWSLPALVGSQAKLTWAGPSAQSQGGPREHVFPTCPDGDAHMHISYGVRRLRLEIFNWKFRKGGDRN